MLETGIGACNMAREHTNGLTAGSTRVTGSRMLDKALASRKWATKPSTKVSGTRTCGMGKVLLDRRMEAPMSELGRMATHLREKVSNSF